MDRASDAVTDPAVVHRFRGTCSWTGSTATGYRHYNRTHTATAPPAEASLTLSADGAFLGDARLANPEQLVVLAASSCQLLSFLAVAARARLDVRDYRDDAEALMPEDDPPMRLTEIVLRPNVVVAEGPTEDRVRHLIDVAHRQCFIANSLATPVRVEPTIAFVAAD